MNRTYMYLYRPYLVSVFGRETVPALKALETKAEGVSELNAYLSINGSHNKEAFYIVCDSNHPSFQSSMSLISTSTVVEDIFYINDRLVAITVPTRPDHYEHFIKGNYSKMYPISLTSMKCFAEAMNLRGKGKQALAALKHDENYYYDVIYPLTESLRDSEREKIFAGEYDSPPDFQEEFFNT